MSEQKPLITRVLKVVILPKGDSIFSETATEVEILDEAAGEFVEIRQAYGTIRLDISEWLEIKKAVDTAFAQITKHEKP